MGLWFRVGSETVYGLGSRVLIAVIWGYSGSLQSLSAAKREDEREFRGHHLGKYPTPG